MLVFWKENLVILAVPKTGTTALEHAIGNRAALVVREPPTLKHSPVYRYHRFFRPMFVQVTDQKPELMGVIRNPIDWLGSWYRYRLRDELEDHPNSTRGISFDDFVEEYCKGKPAPFADVGSQARFLSDGDGEIGVDHLFRYEAQPRIHAFLQERLDLTIETRPMNVSPPAQILLSSRVEARLRDKRPKEFAFW